MHIIQAVKAQANARVQLTFESGEIAILDFSDTIQQGGVFQPLDDAAFFRQVAVGDRGRSIEWPGGIDFCADALWQEAFEQGALKS
jgi:hypothetical protein